MKTIRMKQKKKLFWLRFFIILTLILVFVPKKMTDVQASQNAIRMSYQDQTISLSVGQTKTLYMYIGNCKTYNNIWKSSNSKVAKINKNGKITAISAGTVTITGYPKRYPYAVCKCKVTVKGIVSNGTTSYDVPKNGETYYISTAMSNKYVLDAYNCDISDGTNVQLWNKNGGRNQVFKLVYVSNGWYKIVNLNANRVLDVWGNTSANASVKLCSFNGGNNQLFKFVSAGNGYYYIINKMGYYLDAAWAECKNGTDVITYPYNGNKNQKWRFKKAIATGVVTPAEGTYTIRSAQNDNYVLDVTGAAVSNGTPMEVWQYNGGNNQKFKLERVSTSNWYYRLIDANSGKAVDVYDGTDKNGQMVDIWEKNNTAAQKFTIWSTGEGNGRFYIKYGDSKCLDISGGSVGSGKKVVLWTVGDGLSQKWTLEKTTVSASTVTESQDIGYPMKNFTITQGFAYFNQAKYEACGRGYHSGIDMTSSSDTNIYAAASGQVIYARDNGGNGKHILIRHDINGCEFDTLYSHMSRLDCKYGDYVTRGQKIGVMGNTGASNGPHLHFAVCNNEGNDPYGYTEGKYSPDFLKYNGAFFYNPEYVIKYGKLP